jgi:hypothetical protein
MGTLTTVLVLKRTEISGTAAPWGALLVLGHQPNPEEQDDGGGIRAGRTGLPPTRSDACPSPPDLVDEP